MSFHFHNLPHTFAEKSAIVWLLIQNPFHNSAELRALQTKDAITPESLAYILQRLADLLATAGTSDTVKKLQKLLDGFKTVGYALTKIQPLSKDRNHIYANIGKVSLTDGTMSNERVEFIHQATTERTLAACATRECYLLYSGRRPLNLLPFGIQPRKCSHPHSGGEPFDSVCSYTKVRMLSAIRAEGSRFF